MGQSQQTIATNDSTRVLTFSNRLFAQMAEKEESVAVFRVNDTLQPVTLVLADRESFDRHREKFPDAEVVGHAHYQDIEKGYVASDLVANGFTDYEKITRYLEEQENKGFILERIPGFLGRLFGANADMAEKQKVANNTFKHPQLN